MHKRKTRQVVTFFSCHGCRGHALHKHQSNQTLAGGLIPQSHLHHLEHVLVGAAHELLVCSDSDLRILLGGAVQLQQHRPLREGN